jgi:hypothetical protein
MLGIRDYETTLTDEVRDLIQRALGSFSRLLFLGCGDTFADPRQKMKTAAPQHYALVSADQVAARNADPAWHGYVEPISYGADRRRFPAFLLKHFPATIFSAQSTRFSKILPRSPAKLDRPQVDADKSALENCEDALKWSRRRGQTRLRRD